MPAAQTSPPARAPLGLVALNLGGPGLLDDVRPFLQRLFTDPEVLQIRWSPLRRYVAWSIARKRAPFSRAGLRADRRALADPRRDDRPGAGRDRRAGRARDRRRRRPSPWRPGIRWPTRRWRAWPRAASGGSIALPLYPQESRTTTDSSLARSRRARARHPRWRSPRPALPGRRRLSERRGGADRGRDSHPAARARRDGAGSVLRARPARGLHPQGGSLPRRHPDHRRGGLAADGARRARPPQLPEQGRAPALARPLDRDGAGRDGRGRRRARWWWSPSPSPASTSRPCRRSTSSSASGPRRPASPTSRAPAPSARTRRSSPPWRSWRKPPPASAAGSSVRIAIIGGGISGLTAAHLLVGAGHDVTLVDDAAEPGGLIGSARVDGFLCERGPAGGARRVRSGQGAHRQRRSRAPDRPRPARLAPPVGLCRGPAATISQPARRGCSRRASSARAASCDCCASRSFDAATAVTTATNRCSTSWRGDSGSRRPSGRRRRR